MMKNSLKGVASDNQKVLKDHGWSQETRLKNNKN